MPTAVERQDSKDGGELSIHKIVLKDNTLKSGLDFEHSHGGGGSHYYIEVMGPGCAFLDFDNDGWQDILLLQGAPLPDFDGFKKFHPSLFINNGDGTFEELTSKVGLELEFYCLGIAVADYDNDGWADLFFTALYGNRLFRNDGGRQFVEVTDDAGVQGRDMSTSATWLDYDLDGWLDLFVARYMDYDLETNPRCKDSIGRSSYCTPHAYQPTQSILYRNNGDGSFTDVSEYCGVSLTKARAMGIACADFNGDELIDIFVSSDLSANLLFVNQGDGTFKEGALLAGVAYSEFGTARAGMGVDCGDYDNDGDMDLIVTNFAKESNSLFRNEGNGMFSEKSVPTGISHASRPQLGWGCKFVDFNLDGFTELFWVNGHVNDYADEDEDSGGHSQAAQLLVNDRDGKFVDVSDGAGDFFQRLQVARGAAFRDYDNDGDTDVLVACNNQPCILLRNDTKSENHWIQLKLAGDGCNRDALGAKVKAVSDDLVQTQFLRSGTSYLSDHDRRLLFGLGNAEFVKIVIDWPCGSHQEIEAAPNSTVYVEEESCKLKSEPMVKK